MPKKPEGPCISGRMIRLDKRGWHLVAIRLTQEATALEAVLREGKGLTRPLTTEERSLVERRLDLVRNAVAQARDGAAELEDED